MHKRGGYQASSFLLRSHQKDSRCTASLAVNQGGSDQMELRQHSNLIKIDESSVSQSSCDTFGSFPWGTQDYRHAKQRHVREIRSTTVRAGELRCRSWVLACFSQNLFTSASGETLVLPCRRRHLGGGVVFVPDYALDTYHANYLPVNYPG